MTSLAFILGVLPLVVATGAGQVARHSVGTTVAGGMLVSTFLNCCSSRCSTSSCRRCAAAGLAVGGDRTGRRMTEHPSRGGVDVQIPGLE